MLRADGLYAENQINILDATEGVTVLVDVVATRPRGRDRINIGARESTAIAFVSGTTDTTGDHVLWSGASLALSVLAESAVEDWRYPDKDDVRADVTDSLVCYAWYD